MSGWFWIAVVVGILLAIGGWTDWRRRYSGGGNGRTPSEARRDAVARALMWHNPTIGPPD